MKPDSCLTCLLIKHKALDILNGVMPTKEYITDKCSNDQEVTLLYRMHAMSLKATVGSKIVSSMIKLLKR